MGSDAEAKFTPTGKAVTNLSLATKTRFLKDNQWQERIEWHHIEAWGKLAEYGAAFRKGAHLEIEGELRSREYENKGVQVRTYDIVANSILSIRPGQRNGAQESAATEAPAPETPAPESEPAALPPETTTPRRTRKANG
jgi:single-strand DNA-binding protein